MNFTVRLSLAGSIAKKSFIKQSMTYINNTIIKIRFDRKVSQAATKDAEILQGRNSPIFLIVNDVPGLNSPGALQQMTGVYFRICISGGIVNSQGGMPYGYY